MRFNDIVEINATIDYDEEKCLVAHGLCGCFRPRTPIVQVRRRSVNSRNWIGSGNWVSSDAAKHRASPTFRRLNLIAARRSRNSMLHYGGFWVGPTSVGPNPLPFKRVDGKARLKSDLPDSQFRDEQEIWG